MNTHKLTYRLLAFTLVVMLAFPTSVFAEPAEVGSTTTAQPANNTTTDDTTQTTPPSEDNTGDTTDPENPDPELPEPEPEPKPEPITPDFTILTVPSSCSIEYKSGKTYALKVKTNGDGAITYSTSNKKVVTVSRTGVLTVKGTGVCYITVKAAGTKNYKAAQETIRVTVWKQPKSIGYSSSYKKGVFYKRLMKLQLYGSTRQNLLKIAASQLGYHESSSSGKLAGNIKSSRNYTEYGRYYGYNGVPWCAIFVNWVARQNGISRSVVPKYCAVRHYYSYYRNRRLVRSWSQVRTGKYTPKKGDIIFYSYVYGGTTHHIGYVEDISRTGSKITITTIEGNRSDKVSRVKMTLKKSNTRGKISGYYITGFSSPKY